MQPISLGYLTAFGYAPDMNVLFCPSYVGGESHPAGNPRFHYTKVWNLDQRHEVSLHPQSGWLQEAPQRGA